VPDAGITIVDPTAVRAGRVIDESGDWIVTTYEATFEGEDIEVAIAIEPEQFINFIIASLNALGFPEGDTEYIAARWAREAT
jgi:hypothetical protein